MQTELSGQEVIEDVCGWGFIQKEQKSDRGCDGTVETEHASGNRGCIQKTPSIQSQVAKPGRASVKKEIWLNKLDIICGQTGWKTEIAGHLWKQ